MLLKVYGMKHTVSKRISEANPVEDCHIVARIYGKDKDDCLSKVEECGFNKDWYRHTFDGAGIPDNDYVHEVDAAYRVYTIENNKISKEVSKHSSLYFAFILSPCLLGKEIYFLGSEYKAPKGVEDIREKVGIENIVAYRDRQGVHYVGVVKDEEA
jgi:hypothetical protein